MTDSPNAPSGEYTRAGYLSDAENAAEMARLMVQDRLLTQEMGRLVPEPIDLSQVHQVLDIGCGPGGWLLDLVAHSPHIQGVGIDISHLMVEYAMNLATSQGLSNVQFRVMDATQPLQFADNTFDLVNGRILMGFLLTHQWSSLLQECYRITKPGGMVCLTEGEWGFTNSPALDTLSGFAALSFSRAGHSFSPHGRTFGTAAVLPLLLRQANYRNIQQRAYAIDFSAGRATHENNVQNLLIVYKLLQPLFVQMQLASQEELQSLYAHMEEEIQTEHFCGMDYFSTVFGYKDTQIE
jgi:ubiquinone/menaquinone biosynthesis C-methylase UbiE